MLKLSEKYKDPNKAISYKEANDVFAFRKKEEQSLDKKIIKTQR
jgi:hypothetical protein